MPLFLRTTMAQSSFWVYCRGGLEILLRLSSAFGCRDDLSAADSRFAHLTFSNFCTKVPFVSVPSALLFSFFFFFFLSVSTTLLLASIVAARDACGCACAREGATKELLISLFLLLPCSSSRVRMSINSGIISVIRLYSSISRGPVPAGWIGVYIYEHL